MEVNEKIFEKVLYVGTDYRNPRGGISSVLNTYSHFIQPFKIVITAAGGNSRKEKIWYAAKGYVSLIMMLAKDKGIKIVHIHSASENSFWRKSIVIKIAKWFGKKVIFHCHGGGFKEFRQNNKEKVDNILGKVDCVACLSDEWNRYFNGIGCKRVVTIRNVIENPNKAYIPKDGLVHFLFLGLICNNKGIFDVLNAIADHKDELEGKIMLHIGGNGEVERLDSELKRLGIEDMVRYEGWLDKEKKQKLLSTADVYIMPSYVEGVPISILEAESYHKPVITTNVGGVGSIVKDQKSGIFVAPGNREEIYHAMKILADNETLRSQLGEAGYVISRDYLPEAVMNELINCYSAILCD